MTKQPKPSRKTDPFVLYQQAVQSPEADIGMVDRHYRKLAGRPARTFREDFCGTALLSCAWVQLGPERRAMGIDLDAPTLRWARKHNLSQLSDDERGRIDLVRANVLDVHTPKTDIRAAFNFSYWVFKTRPQMLAYIRNAKRSLNRGGMLMIDVWGGSESLTVHQDRKRVRGFTYIWDQRSFDPISGFCDCRIHFEFPDGSRLRNAFTYDWRLWTLPEMRDILDEAGFKDIHVLWETTERSTGRGSGIFRRTERAEAEKSWIACLIGRA
jgi:SAM-dependent methyltransferase